MLNICFYICHFLFIVITIPLVFWIPELLIVQLIIIISWEINNNKCLITELEDYLFGETMIEFCLQRRSSARFIVPKIHRYILYVSFLLGLFYHFSPYINDKI